MLSGDTFIYKIPSQWFLDQPVLLGQNSTPALSTPYETLNELVRAYAGKNANKIVSLYSPAARSYIRDLITGKNGGELLNYYAGAKNVVLLGAIKYRNGFMIFSRDDQYGIHENYITATKGKYYLTPLDDGNSPTAWNIAQYLKHPPGPVYNLPQFVFPDSISVNDSLKIECSIPKGYWVYMHYDIPRHLIPYRIEDNGPLDLDRSPGNISFFIRARNFPGGKGMHTFLMSSTSFPVMYVAPTLLSTGRKYKIKLF